jgi:uncharacterized protein with ATP-grasp and redox domains
VPQRPLPLRTDASNAFAHYSMHTRVPAIARDVATHNAHYPAAVKRAIEALARDIETNAPIPPPHPPAPDVIPWTEAYDAHRGETWLATEWFYAEYAFYRELARACRYWETGRDPFAYAKDEELAGDGPWSRLGAALEALPSLTPEERVASLMEQSLWGNRVDLSYRVAAARVHAHEDDLLADDRAKAVPLLLGTRAGAPPHVHVAADNTGTELALDMALVDCVLHPDGLAGGAGGRARVTVHVKHQPVFVSDATAADVWNLIERMRARGGPVAAMGERLRAAFDEERLSIAPDPYWSGPGFLWNMPTHLRDELAKASILVLKGDANYRRLSGDALWPLDATFAGACEGLPCPVACIRTMKSDSVVGLPAELVEKLDATEVKWRIDGKRGVVQVGA